MGDVLRMTVGKARLSRGEAELHAAWCAECRNSAPDMRRNCFACGGLYRGGYSEPPSERTAAGSGALSFPGAGWGGRAITCPVAQSNFQHRVVLGHAFQCRARRRNTSPHNAGVIILACAKNYRSWIMIDVAIPTR
jgi:hypothetical protein